MSACLLDTDVLIALVVAEHEHHDRAAAWMSGVQHVALCPVTEGALLRFLVRTGESMPTATAVLTAVRAHPRCVFWADSISYLELDGSTITGHRQLTDTYLAGLARSHGEQLATLDEALAQRHPESCLLVP